MQLWPSPLCAQQQQAITTEELLGLREENEAVKKKMCARARAPFCALCCACARLPPPA